jgi:CO/xanthine dehydrogenase FAD-binding subunit
MKLAAPETLPEALRLLASEGARCLAGGQSLVAMMNAHLVEPALLVSLRRISRLNEIVRRDDGGLRLGAMAVHADVARLKVAAAGPGRPQPGYDRRVTRACRPRCGLSGSRPVR